MIRAENKLFSKQIMLPGFQCTENNIELFVIITPFFPCIIEFFTKICNFFFFSCDSITSIPTPLVSQLPQTTYQNLKVQELVLCKFFVLNGKTIFHFFSPLKLFFLQAFDTMSNNGTKILDKPPVKSS